MDSLVFDQQHNRGSASPIIIYFPLRPNSFRAGKLGGTTTAVNGSFNTHAPVNLHTVLINCKYFCKLKKLQVKPDTRLMLLNSYSFYLYSSTLKDARVLGE